MLLSWLSCCFEKSSGDVKIDCVLVSSFPPWRSQGRNMSRICSTNMFKQETCFWHPYYDSA